MGVTEILAILALATQTLEGVLSGDAQKGDMIAENLIQIAQKANAAHQAQVGKPIDPTLLQPIDKV